ncbi:MAG: VOC family protein [Clostridiales bacterium]|nr:VOC family protein [Clostridiales bacterium]
MKFKPVHENYNVSDLEKSLKFYDEALGLKEKRRKVADDGSYIIVFIGNDTSEFEMELTWLKDHPQKYNLGECEFHLAFRVAEYEEAYKKHKEMGCVCFENPKMGIYFIIDPDGYWLEIVPVRD